MIYSASNTCQHQAVATAEDLSGLAMALILLKAPSYLKHLLLCEEVAVAFNHEHSVRCAS